MPKCWIIEQGEYSDYRVVGIFSTEENAKRAKVMFAKDNYLFESLTIAEREFDPGIAELNEGLNYYAVRFANGFTTAEPEYSTNNKDWHWDNRSIYYVWAKNYQAAIKIAAERHTQYLAQLAGMT